jgi:hypothetical protein
VSDRVKLMVQLVVLVVIGAETLAAFNAHSLPWFVAAFVCWTFADISSTALVATVATKHFEGRDA